MRDALPAARCMSMAACTSWADPTRPGTINQQRGVHAMRTQDQRTDSRARGRIRSRTLVLAGLAAALAACTTVGPDFVKPEVTSNPAWNATEMAQLDTSKAVDGAW